MKISLLHFITVGAAAAFTPCTKLGNPSTTSLQALQAIFDPEAARQVVGTSSEGIMVGLGAIAAGLGGLLLGNKKENMTTTKQVVVEEPEIKIDVSIPYNAAALMAYEKVIGEYDEAKFTKFEALYLEKAVAEVTLKKVTRELQQKIDQAEDAISKLAQ